MIPVYPQQMIPPKSPLVEKGGSGTHSLFYFLRALFNRTGGNSGLLLTVGNNLVAAGADQADALGLSNDLNEIVQGAGGVRLAALQPTQMMWVYNGLGGNLNVYPPVKGQINAIAVNGPYVLATGTTQLFTCYSQLGNGGAFFRTLVLG